MKFDIYAYFPNATYGDRDPQELTGCFTSNYLKNSKIALANLIDLIFHDADSQRLWGYESLIKHGAVAWVELRPTAQSK